MGAACTTGKARVAALPGDFPGARRIVFCGLACTGKSSLIRALVRWSCEKKESGSGEKAPLPRLDPEVSQIRTEAQGSQDEDLPTLQVAWHTVSHEGAILIDTPGIDECDSYEIIGNILAAELQWVSRVVFIVDTTNFLTEGLAHQHFCKVVTYLSQTKSSPGITIVGNHRFRSSDDEIDLESWVAEGADLPIDGAIKYSIVRVASLENVESLALNVFHPHHGD